MKTTQLPLTPNEKKVLEFIQKFIKARGFSPTYEEIKDKFEFASYFSVQRYLKQLEAKGYVKTPWKNKKRALEIIEASPEEGSIPFLGRVAAGKPIEAIEQHDMVQVPLHMVRKQTFALKVVGESMIDDGIHDGDILVIQKQATAHNGQTVVALIDNEATVKRFYHRGEQVELRPANPVLKPFFVEAHKVSISGIVIGLVRSYR